MQPPPRPPLTVGDELAAVHARLSGILLTEQTVETALQLITSLARDTLVGSVGSGVTLLHADGRPATSASTNPLIDTLDRLGNVHTARSAARIGDDLKETLRARDVIAIATGMVMVRRNLDSEHAYRYLVTLARSARIPPRELADRMLAAPVRTRASDG